MFKSFAPIGRELPQSAGTDWAEVQFATSSVRLPADKGGRTLEVASRSPSGPKRPNTGLKHFMHEDRTVCTLSHTASSRTCTRNVEQHLGYCFDWFRILFGVIRGDYWAVVWKNSRFLMPVSAGVCVDSIGIANTGKLIRSSLLQRRKSTVYMIKLFIHCQPW